MVRLKNRKIYFCLLCFLSFGFIAKAQKKIAFLDSLKALPNNAANIKSMIDLGTNYDNVDYNLALNIFKIAETKYGNNKIDTTLGVLYEKISSCYTRLYNSSEAIKYLIKMKEIGENLGKNKLITSAYSGIANVYLSNNNYEKAIENFEKAVSFSKGDFSESLEYKSANLANIGYVNYIISQNLNKNSAGYRAKYLLSLQRAIIYHQQSFKIDFAQKNKYRLAKQAVNLCLVYIALPNADSAKYYYNYSEMLLKTVKQLDVLCEHLFNKGKIAESNNNLVEALAAYQASLKIAKKVNYQEYIIENNFSLYRVAQSMGDYKNAMAYFTTYSHNRDSLLNRKNLVEVMELQSDYELKKKDLELQKKSTNNKILIGLFSGLCMVTFLGYKNFKNRQLLAKQNETLQSQKITDLEKDKQLLAVDAMLKGQENERSRIAKDLHDGLGGMLTGVKISFNNLKEKINLHAENDTQFDNSIKKLDDTISELRKISYNLMPEALLKFGLSDAINDFCTSTMQATQINIAYETLGTARELDSTAKIYIYRIVQELINNAVKHAKPTHILVQMTIADFKILITVEDNGKGMEASKMEHSKGIGISNITHRVNYFKGNLSFENNIPNGTVVNIELNV